MAVSGWMVWKSQRTVSKRAALIAFGTQLLLNSAWSAIFFGLHNPGWALVEICFLWFAILWTIMLFRPLKDRLDVAHAIPGVGQLRSRVELWLLVSEPLSHLNPPIFTCCKQWIFATQYRQK